MDGDAGAEAEPYAVPTEDRGHPDPAVLDRELSRIHPDVSGTAGTILSEIALMRRDSRRWRPAPKVIANERTRATRVLGSRAARAVDALLVVRSLQGEPLSVVLPAIRAWTPFVESVLDDRYAPHPVFTMRPFPTRGGRVEWIHRSMRLYFCVGFYWCERSGVPRRWFLDVRGRDRIRLIRYWMQEVRALRPLYTTHLPPIEHGRHLTEEQFVSDHLEIARHMTLEPNIRGIRSASWFYDPNVPAVSKHLSFIGSILDSGGCIRFQLPTLPSAIDDALGTSQHRREAYAAGTYRPRVFGRLWSRERFLRWAGATEVERMRGARMSER